MASSVFVNPAGGGFFTFDGTTVTFPSGAAASATRFLAGDGTVALPAFAFTSQTSTGMWLPAASNIGFSLAGTEYVRIEGGNGNLRLRAGSALEFASSAMNTPDAALKRAGVGHVLSSLGRLLDFRVNAAITADSNQTYTAANVLGGIVTRSGITANRVDAMPTAANLVAAMPGCVVGTTFDFIINNNDDASTITFNGASAGITYEGAATALAAGDAWHFLVHITNVTGAAEAATCYQLAK